LINCTNILLHVVWRTVDTHDVLRVGSIPLSNVRFFKLLFRFERLDRKTEI